MAGTIIGSFIGVIASSKLTNFRLKQLEQKVDKHNNFAERIPVVEEKIKVLNHRVEDLENQNK
nr:MAG TPA: hemolysin [Caudoviricetes sp.]